MTSVTIDTEAFHRFELSRWDEEGKPEAYDRVFGSVTRRAEEPILDAARVGPGTMVLDLASGPGYVAAAALRRRATPIGADFSSRMVALASRLHPDIEFRQADAEKLDFADASFDAVVASFLLLHLGDPERAVGEMARVLRPGGWVALTVWDRPERARLFGFIPEAMTAAGASPPADLPAGPSFFHYADPIEFTALLRSAGLTLAEVTGFDFVHYVPTANDLWDGLRAGGARTPALLDGHTEEVARRIRSEFDRLVSVYSGPHGLEIPVAVKVGAARKPL